MRANGQAVQKAPRRNPFVTAPVLPFIGNLPFSGPCNLQRLPRVGMFALFGQHGQAGRVHG
jgi:hypothetical protein